MSFLDNLENSLKSLEAQDERDPNAAEREENARKQAVAAAPWADQLRSSDYTRTLFDKAALAGHKMRTKIYMAWLGTTLRLEAKGQWCELRPTPGGVIAVYMQDGNTVSLPVDLGTDPDEILARWLQSLV